MSWNANKSRRQVLAQQGAEWGNQALGFWQQWKQCVQW